MFKNKFNLAATLFGTIFLFSCQEEETLITSQSLSNSENFVSLDMATVVSGNFSYDQALMQEPNKKEARSLFRSNQFKSEKKIKETLTIYDSDSVAAFYVIQFEPKGFVIVSGSRKETPILAFSENGNFDYNSDLSRSNGFTEWIKTRKKRIEQLRNDPSVGVSEEVEEQWAYAAPPVDGEETVSGGSVYEQEGPLLSTTWDQGCGYNDLLNTCTTGGSCGRVWTGCVATATAQVMRYWKHPGSYDWGDMPNEEGSPEISLLMADIGVVVNMNFGCDGSAAYTSDARDALDYYFGYSGAAAYIDYNTSTLMTQLNVGWPVILEGYGSAGHAWVCDGYKRDKYTTIHNPGTIYEYETYTYSPLYLWMNWGWGGRFEGWFLYNDFTPDYGRDYNSNRKMIINIHP